MERFVVGRFVHSIGSELNSDSSETIYFVGDSVSTQFPSVVAAKLKKEGFNYQVRTILSAKAIARDVGAIVERILKTGHPKSIFVMTGLIEFGDNRYKLFGDNLGEPGSTWLDLSLLYQWMRHQFRGSLLRETEPFGFIENYSDIDRLIQEARYRDLMALVRNMKGRLNEGLFFHGIYRYLRYKVLRLPQRHLLEVKEEALLQAKADQNQLQQMLDELNSVDKKGVVISTSAVEMRLKNIHVATLNAHLSWRLFKDISIQSGEELVAEDIQINPLVNYYNELNKLQVLGGQLVSSKDEAMVAIEHFNRYNRTISQLVEISQKLVSVEGELFDRELERELAEYSEHIFPLSKTLAFYLVRSSAQHSDYEDRRLRLLSLLPVKILNRTALDTALLLNERYHLDLDPAELRRALRPWRELQTNPKLNIRLMEESQVELVRQIDQGCFELGEICRQIPIIFMSYPNKKADGFRSFKSPTSSVYRFVYMDNHLPFAELLTTHSKEKIFKDDIGRGTGHLTHFGNSVFADKIIRLMKSESIVDQGKTEIKGVLDQ